MASLSIPKHRILAISLHTREKPGYSARVIRRVGVVCLLALLGAFALGGGAPPASAAPQPGVMVEIVGAGSVTGSGISCGLGKGACYATYSSATVALTASPARGWTFSGWEDDASTCGATAANCSVTAANPPATATAVFAPPSGVVSTSTYGVALAAPTTLNPTGGSVTGGSTQANSAIDCSPDTSTTNCSTTVLTGSTITVVENPENGFFFGGWGGSCTGTSVSCATYLSSNQTASATFVASTTNQLT